MNKKEIFMDTVFVIVGNFILAAGVALFIVPNEILSGGVAGIAIAIQPLIDVDPTVIITTLTVALFIVGSILLGKGFMVKTLLSTFLFPIFVFLITQMAHEIAITKDPILASVYGGAFVGGGLGLVLRTGASTGGMDIPPLVIHKYSNIKVHTLIVIVDGLTVLLGMAIHGVEAALIGIISVWISGVMINKAMMVGLSDAQSIMIISTQYEEIAHEVAVQLDRGATLLEASGMYTNEKRPVLMIVIFRKQFPILNRIVNHADPNAFIIVHDVNEVQGEGFTSFLA